MRKKHKRQIKATGDAAARYERLSHSGSIWFDLMPTPADGADGGTFVPVPPAPAVANWPAFDGSSWVDLGQPVKMDFPDAFSIAFWSKQSVDAPPGSERIVARDQGGFGRAYIAQGVDTTGAFSHMLWGIGFPAPTYKIVTTPANPLGLWRYATYINEGVGKDLVAFVDGVEQARTVGGGGAMVLAPVNTLFGRDGVASATYQGDLDTVRFYSRTLSADEIMRDYNAGKTAHP